VAGSLYAADLVGAMLGAVAVAAVLLPALGLVQTALLVALLKAGSFLLVGTAWWRGGIR
jgi:predicted membrane-bound spermidine synthase